MRALTKFIAVSALLFAGGFCVSSFAGPERIEPKDKVVMAPPPCDPRWYVSIGGSVEKLFGDFSNAVDQDILGVADLHIVGRDWDDTYELAWNIQGEVGYVLTSHIELFGTFRYTHADAKIVTGSFLDFGTFAFDFVSKYGDYDSYGGELGFRYFFLDKQARIRPYVSIAGGATWVNSIGLHADSDFLGFEFTAYNGPFYDDTLVATVTGLVGIEFQVIPCKFSVGIDAGIRWQSELDGNDSAFNTFSTNVTNAAVTGGTSLVNQGAFQSELAAALSRMNNGNSDQFSIPVTVYAKFRF
jgi:hypothetical protein